MEGARGGGGSNNLRFVPTTMNLAGGHEIRAGGGCEIN